MNYPVFSRGVVNGGDGGFRFYFCVVAFVRLEILTKTLKEKVFLDETYKEDN